MNQQIPINLSGHHAIVTGGGTGIGLAITRALCAVGAKVTIMGRDYKRLYDIAESDEMIDAIELDVTNPKSVTSAFAKASEVNSVSILINNAGAAQTSPIQKTSLEQWQTMLSVNLTGTFLTTQAALTDIHKAENGRIINIASTSGLKGYPYTSAYTAAKHGVIGLTRTMALELAQTDVTVNAICPGFTNTAIVQEAIKNITAKTALNEQQALDQLVSHNPEKRLIEPEEIAQAVLWLCNKESQNINGQCVVVAGGELMAQDVQNYQYQS